MESDDFSNALVSLLHQYGGALTEPQLRRETKDCRDDVYADNLAHGGRIDDPFFHFVVVNSVAVFTFFESQFSVYAVHCDEAELIAQTNDFALGNIAECKKYLASKYQKLEPDLVVPRAVCEHWLEA